MPIETQEFKKKKKEIANSILEIEDALRFERQVNRLSNLPFDFDTVVDGGRDMRTGIKLWARALGTYGLKSGVFSLMLVFALGSAQELILLTIEEIAKEDILKKKK